MIRWVRDESNKVGFVAKAMPNICSSVQAPFRLRRNPAKENSLMHSDTTPLESQTTNLVCLLAILRKMGGGDCRILEIVRGFILDQSSV